MKIGFIGGTGNLGFGLAVRCAKAGHDILIGSRSESKAKDGADRLKVLIPVAKVCGSANKIVAQEADLLILSIPFAAHEVILKEIGGCCRGKVVLDTTVPMIYKKPPEYHVPAAGSAGENVKILLPESRVVSGLHTVSASLLADPETEINCDALVCGDDLEAKELIIKLCRVLGLPAFDAGPLSNAQSLERLTPLVIGLNQLHKRRHIGIKLSGI